MIAGWLLAPSAFAQCDELVDQVDLLDQVQEVEAAIVANDRMTAHRGAIKLRSDIGCLDGILRRPLAGPIYRAIGVGLVGRDDPYGEGWLKLAAEVAPGFDFGISDLPQEHPAWEAYQRVRAEPAERYAAEGMVFIPGKHYLDGGEIKKPEAVLERPHLYQLEEDSGIRTWMITGNAFPKEVLDVATINAESAAASEVVSRAVDPKAERYKEKQAKKAAKLALKAEEAQNKDLGIKRKTPPIFYPLTIGGGLAVLSGGTMYYLSSVHRKRWEEAPNLIEVNSEFQKTNNFVVGSAIATGVGVGLLGWGVSVQMTDQGSVVPGFRGRF